jgi:hypothetical protein
MGFKTLMATNDGSRAGNEGFDTPANATNFFPVHHGMLNDMTKIKTKKRSLICIVANPPHKMHWNSKDPKTGKETFPGHFLYYVGTTATTSIAINDLRIRVQDASVFSNAYRSRDGDEVTYVPDTNDHIIIYQRNADRTPNWGSFEYAQLTGYDTVQNIITVIRGTSGSDCKAFATGAYIAPHVAAWEENGDKTNQLFYLNYSMHAPKDINPVTGGSSAGVQANEWAATNMAAGLTNSQMDGVEHDEIFNSIGGNRAVDCDNDGAADWGYFNGVNSFGLGCQEYAKRLRASVGVGNKIIQFDGDRPSDGYRGFNFVNGVQMETFMGGKKFSEAYEHLSHWVQRATPRSAGSPNFSYGYGRNRTKLYHAYGTSFGENNEFRKQFAVGLMLGMPHPCGNGQDLGLFEWDEESGGASVPSNHKYKWLGEVAGNAQREICTDLAGAPAPDLLSSAAWKVYIAPGYAATNQWGNDIANGSPFTPGTANSITITQFPSNTNAPNPKGVKLQLSCPTFSLDTNCEYTLTFEAKASDRYAFMNQYGQTCSFSNTPFLIRIDKIGGYVGHVLADSGWRTNTLSFKPTINTNIIVFGISETRGTVWFRNIKFQKGTTDRLSRTFEHGKVFLNMSKDKWVINRADLLPLANTYRYLQGTSTLTNFDGTGANPKNTGALVGTSLTVPPNDAVFLVNTNSY